MQLRPCDILAFRPIENQIRALRSHTTYEALANMFIDMS